MWVVAALLFAGFVPGKANGATLVSNMANATNGDTIVLSAFWLAQKFTTDASAWTITSAQFRGARDASQTVTVSIYDHDGVNDLPALSVATFDASGVTTVIGTQTLPANGTINLAANTSYWFVVAPSNLNFGSWTRTLNLASTGPGTIDFRTAATINGGTSWAAVVTDGNKYMLQLDGTVPDTIPLAFAFVDQSGVAFSSLITSNSITVAGIDSAVAIQVAGGFYSINGGAFTNLAGTVVAGDQVRVQHTSSASLLTAIDTTLTIGGVADTFTSTTLSELPVTEVPALSAWGLALLSTAMSLLGWRRVARARSRQSV